MQVGWGRSPAQAPAAGRREASGGRSRGRGAGGVCGRSRPSQVGSRQQAGRQGVARCRGWAHRETSSCPESRAQPRQVSWVNALHLNSPGRS